MYLLQIHAEPLQGWELPSLQEGSGCGLKDRQNGSRVRDDVTACQGDKLVRASLAKNEMCCIVQSEGRGLGRLTQVHLTPESIQDCSGVDFQAPSVQCNIFGACKEPFQQAAGSHSAYMVCACVSGRCRSEASRCDITCQALLALHKYALGRFQVPSWPGFLLACGAVSGRQAEGWLSFLMAFVAGLVCLLRRERSEGVWSGSAQDIASTGELAVPG